HGRLGSFEKMIPIASTERAFNGVVDLNGQAFLTRELFESLRNVVDDSTAFRGDSGVEADFVLQTLVELGLAEPDEILEQAGVQLGFFLDLQLQRYVGALWLVTIGNFLEDAGLAQFLDRSVNTLRIKWLAEFEAAGNDDLFFGEAIDSYDANRHEFCCGGGLGRDGF